MIDDKNKEPEKKKGVEINLYGDDLKMEMAVFGDGSRIIPRIVVQYGKKYIPWVDNGNSAFTDYPLKVLELYNNSSLHHSIIDMKAEGIAGGGLEVIDKNNPKAAATQDFLDKLNNDNIDCHEVNKRMALDLTIFNGFTPKLTYLKDWSKIDVVDHMELNKVRVERPDENGEYFGYFWAFDWSMYRPSRLCYYPKFNPGMAAMNKLEYEAIYERIMDEASAGDTKELEEFLSKGNSQIYYYKNYTPNNAYYPVPDHVGVFPSVEIDILSDIYATASLVNGMDNGTMITIMGEADDPEAQKTAKRILKSYSGARKAGKPVIIFTADFETAPKLEDIGNSNSLASKYKTINDSTQQKLLSGHRIPNSSLVGIQVAGKLGNTADATNAEEIFFNKYIRPRQEMLEKFWNIVMKFNGLAEVQIVNTNVFNENLADSVEDDIIENPEN